MPGSECCEHCAEIPLLREEVAALRARLNALTTLPLSASGPLPLQAELDVAAKTPPRQMPLFGPVHGPPRPQVDHAPRFQPKIGLYRPLFRGHVARRRRGATGPRCATRGTGPRGEEGQKGLRPPLPCAGLSAAARLREPDRAAAGGQVPSESHDVVRRSGDVRALPGSVRVLVVA